MISDVKMKFNPAALILILLGVLAVVYPLASTMTVGVLTGFVFILIAMSLIVSSSYTFAFNKLVSILSIILAILSILAGLTIIINPLAMSSFASITTYFAGFLMIINGISMIVLGSNFSHFKYIGIASIIFGILYIIIAHYIINPIYLGVLVGIWLIITGIFDLFKPEYEDYIDV